MEERTWRARPAVAFAVRAAVLVAPLSLGCVASVLANRWLPLPGSAWSAVLRTIAIVATSTLVVVAIDRFARRLLPLAALMRLSLVFPDHAPSRFRAALRAGSSRRLERMVEQARTDGLPSDPGTAARHVVEMIGAIGDHDRRTRGHSERVRLYADLLGEELHLTSDDRQKLQWGALLHDLGKLMVPAEILNKRGRPDSAEWTVIEAHPAAGMRLIEPLREYLGEWVYAIGGHHEKWDGSGYPLGLRGSSIPRAAAIVAVADSFEVMTSVRSYKKSMPLAEARAELTRCAGRHFDPDVVRAFLNISLGHLRLVSGPIAALAHLPFIGQLTQLPTAVEAVRAAGGAVLVPAAAVVTATAMTVAPVPAPSTDSTIASGTVPTELAATEPPESAAVVSGATEGGRGGLAEPVPSTTPDGAPTGGTPTDEPVSGAASETTTTSIAAGAQESPAVTAASPALPPTTAARTAPEPPAPMASPAVTAPPPSTAAPTATSPPSSAPPVTTIPPSGSSFTMRVSTNSWRLSSSNLNGAGFAPGTKVYIFSPSAFTEVTYTYPGGTRRVTTFPFDMVGGSWSGATAYTVPSTPGTYTVTATAKGWSKNYSATATFTVT